MIGSLFYALGFVVVIVGLALAAILLGLPSAWTIGGLVVLAVVFAVFVVSHARRGAGVPAARGQAAAGRAPGAGGGHAPAAAPPDGSGGPASGTP